MPCDTVILLNDFFLINKNEKNEINNKKNNIIMYKNKISTLFINNISFFNGNYILIIFEMTFLKWLQIDQHFLDNYEMTFRMVSN